MTAGGESLTSAVPPPGASAVMYPGGGVPPGLPGGAGVNAGSQAQPGAGQTRVGATATIQPPMRNASQQSNVKSKDNSGATGSTVANVPSGHIAVGQEMVTLRFLIKDIKRLEAYQRDFFLKVKESLNHVQMLLDHQLMDAAWSDSLFEAEETLLQGSQFLENANTLTQINQLHNLIARHRETLNLRFQELSVKTSLSEYVVNSMSLLDVDTVHRATQSILRNEVPKRPQQSKNIQIDHTFFLANFCTTSIASSMFASFMPKREENGKYCNTGYSNNNENKMSSSGSTQQHPQPQKPQQQQQQVQEDSYYGINNGIYNGDPYMAGARGPAPGSVKAPTGAGVSGPPQEAVKGGAGNGAGGKGVFTEHELASAISKIACQDDGTAPRPKKVNPWVKDDATTTSGGLMMEESSQQQPMRRTSGSSKATPTLPPSAAKGSSGVDNSSNSPAFMSQNGFSGDSRTPTANKSQRTSGNLVMSSQQQQGPNSESGSSEPDDGRNLNASGVAAGREFDSGKSLSFARITSLNLDKPGRPQQQQQQQQHHQQQQLQHQQPQKQQSQPEKQRPQHSQQLSTIPPLNNLSSSPSGGGMKGMSISPTQNPVNVGELGDPMFKLPSNNPIYYFDITMEGRRLGRVLIEVDPTVAPNMAQNFGMLVTSERGYGYKGCQFFQAWKNESVICGDWEHNSGRGGRSAINGGALFTPDETKLPCIRGAVGMRRMSKKHSSMNEVASQFRIILTNMNSQFTGIFGRVISGLEVMDKVADCGGEGGRPEKIATVYACGLLKS